MIEFSAFVFSMIVFCIGMIGIIVNHKNLITALISIEVMLLAANINFVVFAGIHGIEGYVFSMFILALAAAEAAIGLAIIMTYYRNAKNINVSEINQLRE